MLLEPERPSENSDQTFDFPRSDPIGLRVSKGATLGHQVYSRSLVCLRKSICMVFQTAGSSSVVHQDWA